MLTGVLRGTALALRAPTTHYPTGCPPLALKQPRAQPQGSIWAKQIKHWALAFLLPVRSLPVFLTLRSLPSKNGQEEEVKEVLWELSG